MPGRRAKLIDSETQAGGRCVTGNLNSQLVIDIARFTGGELLKNEVNGVDTTGLYTTSNSKTTPAHIYPITITFSQAVCGFSIVVTNNFGDSYKVPDNLGGPETFPIRGPRDGTGQAGLSRLCRARRDSRRRERTGCRTGRAVPPHAGLVRRRAPPSPAKELVV
jgi:hypothetical protein